MKHNRLRNANAQKLAYIHKSLIKRSYLIYLIIFISNSGKYMPMACFRSTPTCQYFPSEFCLCLFQQFRFGFDPSFIVLYVFFFCSIFERIPPFTWPANVNIECAFLAMNHKLSSVGLHGRSCKVLRTKLFQKLNKLVQQDHTFLIVPSNCFALVMVVCCDLARENMKCKCYS